MSRKLLVVMLAALGASALLIAQGPAKGGAKGKAKAGATVDKIRLLKPNLYLITGGGANTLVRVTPAGLIVVDTKNPSQDAPNNHFERVMEEIRSVSNQPVRYVINTQHHPDHVGNNQGFLDAGATVLAEARLALHMASDPRTRDIPGRPTETFRDNKVLELGGARVELHFYGPGHTGGDTIVYFPEEKIAMVGDQMTDANPIVDFANGGSALHWNDSLNGTMELDFESAIPGRGEPKSRAEVREFRDRFQKLVDRARGAVAMGATRTSLGERVYIEDLVWEFNDAFWGSLYDELKP